MFDSNEEPVLSSSKNVAVQPETPPAPIPHKQGFRKKMLSTLFNRKAGDFLIGAGISAGVSTGTKLGAAALIGLSGAPVVVTAIGAAVVAGAATGAVRHAWNWHKDHRGMENAPSFWSAESGKKAFKSMLMSSVFAGAGGATFSTLNHFYGDEIGVFVSKSANWLGLPAPETMMERARDALANTRVLHAFTAVTDVVTAATAKVASAIEVVQIPKTETVSDKIKGFFSNLWWGAKILVGIEQPLSNTPPVVPISVPSLPPVMPMAAPPALPATISMPVMATPLPILEAASAFDPPPVISPPPELVVPPAAPVASIPTILPQTDAFLLDTPGSFDPAAAAVAAPVSTEGMISPEAQPAQEALGRPAPRPSLEAESLVPSAAEDASLSLTPAEPTVESTSFKIDPGSMGFAAFDNADLTSYTIDPKSTAALLAEGVDTSLGFSGPIVPDTNSLIDLTRGGDIVHFYTPTDDALRASFESSLDGATVHESTRALMDIAFTPADNPEAAAEKAQAMKDLAVRAIHGQSGVPKNPELGLTLLQSAAASDNLQAKVDLAYIAYHGLYGVQANPSQALAHMNALGERSEVARNFVSEWTHGSRPAAVEKVSGTGGSLNCVWQVNNNGHLAGGTCRGPGVQSFRVGDTVLVPVLKL